MTNPLTDVITGGFTGVLTGIGDVLGRFIASPDKKLEAQLELTKVATDYQVQILLAEKDLAVQQASVIIAEAKSESWIARNWRPLTMLTFVFIVAFNYIIAPLFSVKALDIPPDMWQLLKLGIGGYVIGRSVEKVVPDVVAAIKK